MNPRKVQKNKAQEGQLPTWAQETIRTRMGNVLEPCFGLILWLFSVDSFILFDCRLALLR